MKNIVSIFLLGFSYNAMALPDLHCAISDAAYANVNSQSVKLREKKTDSTYLLIDNKLYLNSYGTSSFLCDLSSNGSIYSCQLNGESSYWSFESDYSIGVRASIGEGYALIQTIQCSGM